MASWNLVTIGSGNGLLPDGTKPLLEQCWPVITYLWFTAISARGQWVPLTLFHVLGILASYMLSRASRRFSDMMMVPSMASFRSFSVVRTSVMTRCMRSISWRRKIFNGCRAPILRRRSLTCEEQVSNIGFIMLHGLNEGHITPHTYQISNEKNLKTLWGKFCKNVAN